MGILQMRKAADLAATYQISVCAQHESPRTHICNTRSIKQLYFSVFCSLKAEVVAATVLQQILA